MIALSLFRIPAFTGANVLVGVVRLATFGVLFYTSLCLQEVPGLSAVRTGATFLPWVGRLLRPLRGVHLVVRGRRTPYARQARRGACFPPRASSRRCG
jgi:hypothetical protein